MGDDLTDSEPKYRRTPAPERREPGRLPSGRRLVTVIVGMVVLALLTLAIVLIGNDDEEPAATGTTTTSTTTGSIGGSAPDVVVVGQLLPATLGPGWAEVSRESEPQTAEIDASDPCSGVAQPVRTGLLVRAAFDHLGAADVVERAALVAGVVEEGTEVPRLDDQTVLDCLQAGLQPQVAEGNEIVPVDQPLPAPAPGLELTGARFEVRQPDGVVPGYFDLVLLRRDRAVSFALVAVLDGEQALPLEDLVAALDAPLVSGAARLN